ncbi:MAG: murein peptide amidase [Actinomycetota bacterium]|nr:murein peptide amidase [Actinomycetota bacterium]
MGTLLLAGCTHSAAPSGAPAAAVTKTGPRAGTPNVTPTTTPTPTGPRLVREVVRIGTSAGGTPLMAVHVGDPSRPAILVVGCIHGDEAAGIPAAGQLAALTARQAGQANLWVVVDLNPDGVSRGTRTNSRGVDLNRNFAAGWRPAAPGTHYPGPMAASEPETRALAALVARTRPAVGIWFHQALATIDDSEGPPGTEAAMARALGLPERALADYPGSAIGDENSVVAHSGFAVELPAGPLSGPVADRLARTILAVASAPDPRSP